MRYSLLAFAAIPTIYATIIHKVLLQPNVTAHSHFVSRAQITPNVDAFVPFAYPLSQKQDNVYLTKAYDSSAVQASILASLSANLESSMLAVQQGKTRPRNTLVVPPAQPAEGPFELEKRAMQPPFRWDFTNGKIRGVNLGGWLVLEPWITPSLFEASGNDSVVDEWTLCQSLGQQACLARLSAHWSSWITEADIATIASYGLNHVRVPIGYWAFDVSAGEPYVQGQYSYLLQMIGWCQTHGVKVIVDLHGAPGSQNGFDNSGRRGDVLWHTDTTNVNRTLAIIQTLSETFSQAPYDTVVTALQLLNEPAGFYSQDVVTTYKQFAYDGYGIVRYPSGSNASTLALAIHDAFQPLPSWKNFMPAPDFQGVLLDTHIYTIFSNENAALSEQDRISSICNMTAYLAESQMNLWTVVGEWSPAPNDCAGSLNGRGAGSRYDGSYPGSMRVGSCAGFTGSKDGFSTEYKQFLRKFFEVQTTIYEETTSGYIMWAWKTENADEWSWKAGVEGGWIPQNPSEKMYGNQCTS